MLSRRKTLSERNTREDTYPMQRIDALLDTMTGAEFFTKMDQQSYHQMRVTPEHVPRTAFQTTFGSFQFRGMPFGLTNSEREVQVPNARACAKQ